jgi:hypothetical protein
MSDDQLRLHQRLARGENVMEGDKIETPYKNGVKHDAYGDSKKGWLKDSKRSHDGVTRHPDHGPHDMGVPNPRTD